MRVSARSVTASLACAALLAGAAGCGGAGDGQSQASGDRDSRHKGIQPPPNAISPNARMTDAGRDLARDRAVDALTDPSSAPEAVRQEEDDPLKRVSGAVSLDTMPSTTTTSSDGGSGR